VFGYETRDVVRMFYQNVTDRMYVYEKRNCSERSVFACSQTIFSPE